MKVVDQMSHSLYLNCWTSISLFREVGLQIVIAMIILDCKAWVQIREAQRKPRESNSHCTGGASPSVYILGVEDMQRSLPMKGKTGIWVLHVTWSFANML